MGTSQFDQLTGDFLRAVRAAGGGLTAVCGACVRVLPVRRAAIVLHEIDAGMQPWCASDDFADLVEKAQATAGEGPAVAALAQGIPVVVTDFGSECERWPGFAEALAGKPISGSMFAVPLRLGPIPLGAVDMYRDTVGRPSPRLLSAALHIADLVTASLVLASGEAAQQWAQPLSSQWIHQAATMTSTQLGVDIADAYARLRAYAFINGLSLAEVSRRVVARNLRIESV
ncbi:GAF and ANTAR domain-containing protein [Nocardia sp. NBC_01503]|uniref:GAF and ANTAR domain-containing protein n=1 Tax=Nocardia sp. NBC_01503 TaxID=2975997 RepID=UPI002E7C1588|nr:GAF and ANTAR domain-containing protein [Nocardia sp. NBC_01503]WTL29219.1 GAF and ANTAR domain-containing protein [Nocardia sp. NBC_01503]